MFSLSVVLVLVDYDPSKRYVSFLLAIILSSYLNVEYFLPYNCYRVHIDLTGYYLAEEYRSVFSGYSSFNTVQSQAFDHASLCTPQTNSRVGIFY